ncbi:hypothetical protein [Buttiauxella sp.]|uniref:hypothetical protein n=1 Tax=Buttiauxella sp. TaxID=1972222 RepID=UPI003C71568F
MIKMSFFKRRKNVNKKMSILSYITICSFPVFVAIVTTIGMIDYYNVKIFHYNDGYILKIFKLISVSIFFAIVNSISTIYLDKRKINKKIEQFKMEYNTITMSYGENFYIINGINEKAIPDILNGVKKRQTNEGKLISLDIQSISVIVKGINMKKIEYSVYCISLYQSGRRENISFDFYTVNNGDLMLKHIDYPVNVRQAEV